MALKVVKSAQTFTETALDEIKLLKCVSVVTLLSDSSHFGVLLKHSCNRTGLGLGLVWPRAEVLVISVFNGAMNCKGFLQLFC